MTGLARQSVRPSVCPSVRLSVVRAPNSKTKRRRKTKIGTNVLVSNEFVGYLLIYFFQKSSSLGLQQWVETFVCVIAWGGCATD